MVLDCSILFLEKEEIGNIQRETYGIDARTRTQTTLEEGWCSHCWMRPSLRK